MSLTSCFPVVGYTHIPVCLLKSKSSVGAWLILVLLITALPACELLAQCTGVTGPTLSYTYTGNDCSGYNNPATIQIVFTNGNSLIDATVERYVSGTWTLQDGYLDLNGTGTGTFSYHVTQATQFRVTSNDCPALSNIITVNPPAPPAPGAFGTGYACGDGQAHFEVTGAPAGTTYYIYLYSGGNYVNMGSTTTGYFLQNPYSTDEQNLYYVQATINGCTAPPSQLMISHFSLSPPGITSVTTACMNRTATLTASGYADGNYRWYDSLGQYLNATTRIFITDSLQSPTSFRVTGTYEQCESAPTTIPVSVYDPVPNPADRQVKACTTEDITIPAGTTGEANWYDQNDQFLNTTDSLYVGTKPLGTYMYKIEARSDSGCVSEEKGTLILQVGNICSEPRNYIRTLDARRAIDAASIFEQGIPDKAKIMVNTEYFDGIGRPMQTVVHFQSPQGYDLVQPKEYDAYGQSVITYLPYVADVASYTFKDNAQASQHDFYQVSSTTIARDTMPFAQTIIEASPLRRVLKQGAPGENWQPEGDSMSITDHTTKKRYGSNQQEEVIQFHFNPATDSLDLSQGLSYYAPHTLYTHTTYDAHNQKVIEYMDKAGRTILKKVQYATRQLGGGQTEKQYTETYYIYDDFGNLVVVLPPQGVQLIHDAY